MDIRHCTSSLHSSPTTNPITRRRAHSNLGFHSLHLSNRRRNLLLSRRKNAVFVASFSSPSNGSQGFSWLHLSQSVRRGSQRFLEALGESVKKETGFDFEGAKTRVFEFKNGARARLDRVKSELLPEFIEWHRWELWKDIKNWELKRVAILLAYGLITVLSFQSIVRTVRAPIIDRERKELAEAYMEALIPEPTPANIKRFKKGLWRKSIPKGIKLKKFIERPDGNLIHDSSYAGEHAWEDDSGGPEEARKGLKEDLRISDESQETAGNWRERLQAWNDILRREKLGNQLDSLGAKYVIEFDMNEVENSLCKDVVESSHIGNDWILLG